MEYSLRSSPLIIFLAFALYGVVHSLLASIPAKDLAYTFFGKTAERTYRLFYNIFSFVTLLPILALPFTLPDVELYTFPEPWSFVAKGGQILALTLLAYSAFQTGIFKFIGFSQLMGINNEEKLNTRGLYRYMRHPLYTFSLVFLWLTPTMTRNLAILYLSFSMYFIIGAVVEERKLVKTFGDEYLEYMSKTPYLIPFLKWGKNEEG
jgi:protein-S-isoprenylcysteine O-methyltransferase Ste14